MELEQKKELAKKFIRTGLDLDKSLLLAQCTDEEAELCLNDTEFIRHVRFIQAKEEQYLLSKHKKLTKECKPESALKAIQWSLEKVYNPERFGNKKTTITIEKSNTESAVDYSNLTEEEAKKLYLQKINENK